MFDNLSDEIALHILGFSEPETTLSFATTCSEASQLSKDKHLWRHFLKRDYPLLVPQNQTADFDWQEVYKKIAHESRKEVPARLFSLAALVKANQREDLKNAQITTKELQGSECFLIRTAIKYNRQAILDDFYQIAQSNYLFKNKPILSFEHIDKLEEIEDLEEIMDALDTMGEFSKTKSETEKFTDNALELAEYKPCELQLDTAIIDGLSLLNWALLCRQQQASEPYIVTNPNRDVGQGFTPLMLAASVGNIELVKQLLRDQRTNLFTEKQLGSMKITAFHIAATRNQPEILDLLYHHANSGFLSREESEKYLSDDFKKALIKEQLLLSSRIKAIAAFHNALQRLKGSEELFNPAEAAENTEQEKAKTSHKHELDTFLYRTLEEVTQAGSLLMAQMLLDTYKLDLEKRNYKLTINDGLLTKSIIGSSLDMAILAGRVEMVRFLLAKGAKPNPDPAPSPYLHEGVDRLKLVVRYMKDLSILEDLKLKERAASKGATTFCRIAVDAKRPAALEQLINLGYDVSAEKSQRDLLHAFTQGHITKQQRLQEHVLAEECFNKLHELGVPYNVDLLCAAISYNDEETVKAILIENPSLAKEINSEKTFPLYLAITQKQMETIGLLQQCGANYKEEVYTAIEKNAKPTLIRAMILVAPSAFTRAKILSLAEKAGHKRLINFLEEGVLYFPWANFHEQNFSEAFQELKIVALERARELGRKHYRGESKDIDSKTITLAPNVKKDPLFSQLAKNEQTILKCYYDEAYRQAYKKAAGIPAQHPLASLLSLELPVKEEQERSSKRKRKKEETSSKANSSTSTAFFLQPVKDEPVDSELVLPRAVKEEKGKEKEDEMEMDDNYSPRSEASHARHRLSFFKRRRIASSDEQTDKVSKEDYMREEEKKGPPSSP